MTTLVTGAAGFIGSAVVRRLLSRGRRVRCLLEPGAPTSNLDGLDVEIAHADICDPAGVRAALDGCRALYHLAAIYSLWMPDEERIYQVNVEGSKVVLAAAAEAAVERVVYTSSIAAVGRAPDGGLADESCAFNYWDEANAYIRSKWMGEQEALAFAARGLPVVVVNPAFPFGARDLGPTPTGRFVLEALRGKVPGYMAGGFNAVDVEDVAEGHVLAEERGRVGERYILGGHNVSYKEFYEVVCQVAGLPPIRRRLPGPLLWGAGWLMERVAERTKTPPLITYKAARIGSERLWFDCSKARRELGLPRTPLADTVAASVRWFRESGLVEAPARAA